MTWIRVCWYIYYAYWFRNSKSFVLFFKSYLQFPSLTCNCIRRKTSSWPTGFWTLQSTHVLSWKYTRDGRRITVKYIYIYIDQINIIATFFISFDLRERMKNVVWATPAKGRVCRQSVFAFFLPIASSTRFFSRKKETGLFKKKKKKKVTGDLTGCNVTQKKKWDRSRRPYEKCYSEKTRITSGRHNVSPYNEIRGGGRGGGRTLDARPRAYGTRYVGDQLIRLKCSEGRPCFCSSRVTNA